MLRLNPTPCVFQQENKEGQIDFNFLGASKSSKKVVILENVLYLLRVPSPNCVTTSSQLLESSQCVASNKKKVKNYLWASSLRFHGVLSAIFCYLIVFLVAFVSYVLCLFLLFCFLRLMLLFGFSLFALFFTCFSFTWFLILISTCLFASFCFFLV